MSPNWAGQHSDIGVGVHSHVPTAPLPWLCPCPAPGWDGCGPVYYFGGYTFGKGRKLLFYNMLKMPVGFSVVLKWVNKFGLGFFFPLSFGLLFLCKWILYIVFMLVKRKSGIECSTFPPFPSASCSLPSELLEMRRKRKSVGFFIFGILLSRDFTEI